jgi:hypothetical protein
MLKELCENRNLPDIEFFVNTRDFPLLKRNETEAYDNIFGKDVPLLSHNYNKYSPIFSNVTSNEYSDICFPTWEDWCRVKYKEDKKISQTCREYNDIFELTWDNKIPIAVFRGSSTGVGTTIDTNPRLKLANMDQENILDTDGMRFIDAGITDYNTRPRKEIENKYLTTIIESVKKNKMTPSDQSKYKYIINVDGHVSAFRLSYELSMKSVILLVESKWKMWYHSMLIPYKHYIPISKDLSDLYDKIRWCKENDKKCREIAENGFYFYEKYLCKNGIFDYLQKILYETKNMIGNYIYNYVSYKDLLYEDEKEKIKLKDFTFTKTTEKILLKENQNTKIYIHNNILIKESSHEREKEMLHEAFVGLFGINNLKSNNFIHTFGYNSNKLYLENIDNEGTLQKYISSDKFIFKEFLIIFINILLAIKNAQESIGFIHFDLYDYNIILQKSFTKNKFEFVNGNVYIFDTKYNPVIIDYGKSHIVYDGINHGFVNSFQMNSFQDCHTLLVSSLYDIINFKRLSADDVKNVFTLSRFFNKNFNNISELKFYLREQKRFSNLLNLKDKEYLNLDPEILVNYIINKFYLKVHVRINQEIKQEIKQEINQEINQDIDINEDSFVDISVIKKHLSLIKDIKIIEKKYKKLVKTSIINHKINSNIISLYKFSKIYTHYNIRCLENYKDEKIKKLVEYYTEIKKLLT